MGPVSVKIGVILFIIINQVLSFSIWELGNFYLLNEKFIPKKYENDYVKFETCLQPLENRYWDKRIYAVIHVKKTLFNIQATSELKKQDSNGGEYKTVGKVWNHGSICNTTYDVGYFKDCFTGKWNPEKNCSIEPGIYYVRNYTMEDDIKKATYGKFPYGSYSVNATLLADFDGEQRTVVTVTFYMKMKNEKEKKSEPKPPKNKKFPMCEESFG